VAPGIAAGFRFDFADLQPAGLRLLDAVPAALPAGARPLAAGRRPGWLPPLLPAFPTGWPLRVAFVDACAPVFARRLREGLAEVLAAAGRETGVEVLAWPDGLAAGCGGLESLPAEPHAVVVAAELDSESAQAAAQLLRSLDPARAWLALNGDLPGLDGTLGFSEAWFPPLRAGRLARLPQLAERELERTAARPPALGVRRFGLACLALAAGLAGSYLEQQP